MSKNKVSTNSRKKILALEQSLINIADGVNIEGDGERVVTGSKIAPIKHAFADGIYIRQMDMAIGTVVVNVHKNPSNTQNVDELEKEIVALNYEEYEKYINKNK